MEIREYKCTVRANTLEVNMPSTARARHFYSKAGGVIMCCAEVLSATDTINTFTYLYVKAPAQTLNLPWICMLTAGKKHIFGPAIL